MADKQNRRSAAGRAGAGDPPGAGTERRRVGLVLGAGGLIGIAWLAGGLAALQEVGGWGPIDAEIIVGTSAGALVGALSGSSGSREGIEEDTMSAASEEEIAGDLRELGRPRLHGGLPSFGLGSWSLALRALRAPRRYTPLTVYSSLLPSGLLSTKPIEKLVARRVPGGWEDRPNLWVVACDYATGRRVVFGRAGAPAASLSQAVAASCSIPGTYRPVTIAGRRYVDGGMYSTSNLDVLRERGLEAVICFNPTSTLALAPSRQPLETAANLMRRESGRRLGREAGRLRENGTKVAVIQPTAEDLAAMGRNLMSRDLGRQQRVAELARRTAAEQLRRPDVQEVLPIPA